MIYITRLHENDDLKLSIINFCKEHNITAGIIISSVGCLKQVNIRLAKAINTLSKNEDYEILSLNGTCNKDNVHLHISLSDDTGQCIGGHLLEGNIINTTCELAILDIDNKTFKRTYDPNTGYDELKIEEKI